MTTAKNIDFQRLRESVQAKRTYLDKLHVIAEKTGVSQPTLSRFLKGNAMERKNVKLICLWLDRPIEDFHIEAEGVVVTDRETAKELAFRFERLAGLVFSEKISRSKFRQLVCEELQLMQSQHKFLKKLSDFS